MCVPVLLYYCFCCTNYFFLFTICVKVFWFYLIKKKERRIYKKMAMFNEFSRHIMQFLILLFVLSCVCANQRRFSPLLVEDDGSRNNRPAGMFLLTLFLLIKWRKKICFYLGQYRLRDYCTCVTSIFFVNVLNSENMQTSACFTVTIRMHVFILRLIFFFFLMNSSSPPLKRFLLLFVVVRKEEF